MSEAKKDSAPVEAKPLEAKVDEVAVRLASASEQALAQSAKAEGDIIASQRLDVYATAGLAHLETIKCGKAIIDHACEVRGVASTWTVSYYEDQIDTITTRVRATHPELFVNFDAISEKQSPPSKNRERIHTRILVGLVAQSLAALIGEKVWSLPYRLVANYLGRRPRVQVLEAGCRWRASRRERRVSEDSALSRRRWQVDVGQFLECSEGALRWH